MAGGRGAGVCAGNGMRVVPGGCCVDLVLWDKIEEFKDEAEQGVGNVRKGGEVKEEDYPRLKSLKVVVQETVRLYPPLWSLGRSAIRDTMVGDLPIRKGTDVWIPIRQIHRDVRWFSEPNSFNPYRWNDGARRPKFSYFPLGGGRRSCVAHHFT